ncbi:MAG: hypothetical protein COA39_003100 [Sulfurimonas sp.]|nr:hypothetical protein [Sulfurimonas sp.]
MVKVDNSYNKRIFIENIDEIETDILKEVNRLKDLVETRIKRIEDNGESYISLDDFKDEPKAKYLSVYKYKESIEKKLMNFY